MTNSLNLWRVSPYLTKSRLVLQNQFNPGDSNDNGAQCERSPHETTRYCVALAIAGSDISFSPIKFDCHSHQKQTR